MKERLRRIRIELGMTQDQFAKAIHLSQKYVSSLETGRDRPSERYIHRVCEEFHVNEEWLRTGHGEMFTEKRIKELSCVSDRLRYVRKSVGMTQDRFSKEIGYSCIQVQSVEKGIVHPSLEYIRKVALRFNVSESWLKDGIGEIKEK